MSKKSIIAILSAVVLMVVASLTLVFTVGPIASAADETVYTVPVEYLSINDGVLGDGTDSGAFNADGQSLIRNRAKYRVEIPAGVTRIGENAFAYCYGLTSINIPDSVTSIGRHAFEYCSGLTSVNISEGVVTWIDYEAFLGCSGLTSITIPEGVTSISLYAFDGCGGLKEIIVRNPDLMTNTNLQRYASKLHYGAEQNTVSFVTNCDTTIDSRLIDFGEVTTEPTGLTKEHYTFAGWYSDEQYTQPFTFDTPIKYDITLYAKWEENPTVTFMVDGTEYSSETVEYNTLLTVPETPTLEGYNFLGWYNGDEAYDFNTPVTSNMTLTAKWERISEEPTETPVEEDTEVSNKNNNGLLLGILGTSAGVLIIAGVVVGVVIAKRRRK